jgi:hypothetical protein
MPDEQPKKTVKIGVKQGTGPPPGYKWNVDVLGQSHEEAMAFLNEEQYEHLSRQVREVAKEDDPGHCSTVDVKAIEDFYEIREKGGGLRKLNVRIYFSVYMRTHTLVILGVIKKENEGQTPTGVRFTMRRRMRLYLESLEQES